MLLACHTLLPNDLTLWFNRLAPAITTIHLIGAVINLPLIEISKDSSSNFLLPSSKFFTFFSSFVVTMALSQGKFSDVIMWAAFCAVTD